MAGDSISLGLTLTVRLGRRVWFRVRVRVSVRVRARFRVRVRISVRVRVGVVIKSITLSRYPLARLICLFIVVYSQYPRIESST